MKKIWQRESNSFRCAWRGVRLFFKGEIHARVHFLILFFVLLLAYFFDCSTMEYIALISLSAIVLCAEALNSAIERLCDVVQPELDERIRDIKDIAAGAVLISAIGALVAGLLIFGPKIFSLVSDF
ncbi:MAG: diacylglycerol kinase family protein [Saprospiraceae bacterium]|nr:diacylglycerol kinase family protein [Saprospiraceae bacterium]